MFLSSCILGEMFARQPIFSGTSDLDQLERIWDMCGSPNDDNFPGWSELPGCDGVKSFLVKERRVRAHFDALV